MLRTIALYGLALVLGTMLVAAAWAHLYGVSVFVLRAHPSVTVQCVEREIGERFDDTGHCSPRRGFDLTLFGTRYFGFLNTGPDGEFRLTCDTSDGRQVRQFGYYTSSMSRYLALEVSPQCDARTRLL